MKYKVGDRVKIKDNIGSRIMKHWQGKIMTICTVEKTEKVVIYRMIEDEGKWWWYERMIEVLVEPSKETIFQMAIDTYGRENQIRMLHEEMDELGAALSKYHRNPHSSTLEHVREEIEDVQIMLDQARLIFGKSETDYRKQKIERLHSRLRDEQEDQEIEVVKGRHRLYGKTYTWVNPDEVPCDVGTIVLAETENGTKPVIVLEIKREKMKNAGHHKKIVGGFENE